MIVKTSLYALTFASLFLFWACSNSGREDKSDSEGEITEDFSQDSEDESNYRSSGSRVRYSSKPKVTKMASDLVGRTIGEGFAEGYHPADWTYQIEYGQISELRVNEVVTEERDLYVVNVNMHIDPGSAGSYYYDTNLKLIYVNTPDDGWVLDSVSSLGMTVVSNGIYDDCISGRLGDDGWGGVNCAYFRNSSDTPLVVGGRIHNYNGWQKFSVVVEGNAEKGVGGTFSGGSVDDFIIDFVVKSSV